MTSVSSADSTGRRVAIVSDGSTLPSGDDLTATLRKDAELLSGLAQVPVRPSVILVPDAAGLAAGIRALPADIGAVLLTRVEPERSRHVQQDLQGSGARPLLTDEDVTAIALATAALDTLAKAGRRARGSRVVLAGARVLPMLTSLLIAAGIDDLTTWNQADAVIFPLHNVVFGADLVIDLVGALPPGAADRLAGIPAITSDDTGTAPYVVAGLLQAAVRAPGLAFDVRIYRACAHALIAAPPFDRRVSFVKGIAVTQLVADTVTSVFRTPLSR